MNYRADSRYASMGQQADPRDVRIAELEAAIRNLLTVADYCVFDEDAVGFNEEMRARLKEMTFDAAELVGVDL